MSLLTSLGFARANLLNSGDLSSLLSRNIANAGVEGASRKIAPMVSRGDGTPALGAVQRVADSSLYQHVLSAVSQQAQQSMIAKSLDTLNLTVGDPEAKSSPAALIGGLLSSLQQYSVSPSNTTLAQSAVATARQLSSALNAGAQTVQSLRQFADTTIARDVTELNGVLTQFDQLNKTIIGGTLSGRDITDQLDQRDRLVKSISKIIGVTVVPRANNDIALYTDSGVPLFETSARQVNFAPTSVFGPATTGNAVYIDGVQVTGTGAPMAVQAGEIAGAAQVRDGAALDYQAQLDEIARGLITTFAETSTTAAVTAPGLFTYPGAPSMPSMGQTGLAGAIRVAASVDPTKGGNALLLRNGGIAGAAFKANTTGAADFSGHILQQIESLTGNQSFSPTVQLADTATLADFSAASVAWLGAARKQASDSADYKGTVLQTSTNALSNETGINLDDQMMRLLDVERSFQASSKLIATIDNLYNALLAAIN
jgi:flagellar hook-associated protein 1